MTPPDTPGGDLMPNFDELSPEEAMAWLESLAKRQGANLEELTTAANVEIPELPLDTVVDEPGYTPFEASGPTEVAAPPEPVVSAEPAPAPEPFLEAEPVEAADMEWLAGVAAEEEGVEWLTEVAAEEEGAEWVTEVVAEAEVESAAPTLMTEFGVDEQIMADPMAWLESLARRQGAKVEELTTDANYEIPEPPPEAIPEEPGYTPFDPGRRLAVAEPEPEAALSEAEPVMEAEPEFAAEPEPTALPGVAEFGLDELIMADPMAWLESLARRQGVSETELTTAANLDIPVPPPDTVIEEPGYTPYEPFAKERPPAAIPEPAVGAAPPPAEPPVEFELPPAELIPEEEEVVVPAAELQPEAEEWLETLAEAEPLQAWLETESPPAELPTEEMPAVEEVELEPALLPAWLRAAPPAAPPAAQEPVPAWAGAPSEDDSLAWLESLAAEQGVDMAEFLVDTSPMPPVLPEIEEEIAAPQAAMEAAEFLADTEPAFATEEVEEALTLSQAMAAFEEETVLAAALTTEEVEAEVTYEEAAADPLEGLSDEEIETLMASGQLTREQQKAWLDRQAEQLIAVRMSAEEIEEEELPPAIPGELPDWLKDQMPAGFVQAAEPPPLSEEIVAPPEPSGLPDWLSSLVEAEAEFEAGPALEAAPTPESVVGDQPPVSWLESLAEAVEAEQPVLEAPEEIALPALPAEEELPAGEPVALPDWVKDFALEAEVELAEAKPLRDESLSWLAAVPEAEEEAPALAEAAADTSLDWLLEAQEAIEEEAIEVAPEDIAAWLREQQEAPLAAATPAEPEVVSWLEEAVPTEEVAEAFAAEVPAEAPMVPVEPAPTPAPVAEAPPAPPTPVPVPAAPPPTPTPVTPPPVPPVKPVYPLEPAPPEMVAEWFARARQFKDAGEFEKSLEDYERLVRAEQHLNEVVGDLEAVARQFATHVRVRRLLGDVYLRQNRLQEALDTYRGALDQL